MLPNRWLLVSFTSDAEKIDSAEDRPVFSDGPAPERPICISVAFCVLYKAVESEIWRHTGHVMVLTKKDGTPFDPALGDVAQGDLNATVIPDNIMS